MRRYSLIQISYIELLFCRCGWCGCEVPQEALQQQHHAAQLLHHDFASFLVLQTVRPYTSFLGQLYSLFSVASLLITLFLSLAFSCFLGLLSFDLVTLFLLLRPLLTPLLSDLLLIQLVSLPKLCHLCFSKFFRLLVLLLSPLVSACFLYSARRVELSPTVIVLARLELKSFALVLVLLLSLKNLSKALILMVKERVLN
jgi:hypothetical protein